MAQALRALHRRQRQGPSSDIRALRGYPETLLGKKVDLLDS